ncbi:cilia- and flagella-associated protein 107 [Trichomycterus rosablanca]|uniref:cilia- and flagella-associated protein 107 n=1 Tax=Trichomycterus rosablanca TaxID=2290929 RepID=UPI002F35E93F
MHIMQDRDLVYNKWKQPGWRIEQKYSSNVLIGNWVEERLQFTRECKTASTTNRLDFRPPTDHRPDVIVRRRALRGSEGLPARLLLSHHNTPTSHYLVSLYDESYGCRGASALPALRTWHSDKMAWVPERSDHPLHGPPTNYGLATLRQARREQQCDGLPKLSVYKEEYPVYPRSTFCQPHHARALHLVSGRKKT